MKTFRARGALFIYLIAALPSHVRLHSHCHCSRCIKHTFWWRRIFAKGGMDSPARAVKSICFDRNFEIKTITAAAGAAELHNFRRNGNFIIALRSPLQFIILIIVSLASPAQTVANRIRSVELLCDATCTQYISFWHQAQPESIVNLWMFYRADCAAFRTI